MTHAAALLIYDGIDLRHLAQAYTILGEAQQADGEPAFTIHTVARTKALVTLAGGLQVMPDHIYPDAEIYELLFVAGGPGYETAAQNLRLMNWINRASRLARVVVGADTGIFLLAAARLLSGRQVAALSGLAAVEPTVQPMVDRPVVRSGKIMTAVGFETALLEAAVDRLTAG